jgi:hypothetical protein
MPPRWSLDSNVAAATAADDAASVDARSPLSLHDNDDDETLSLHSDCSSSNGSDEDDSLIFDECRDPSSSCSKQRERTVGAIRNAIRKHPVIIIKKKKAVRFAEYAHLHLYDPDVHRDTSAGTSCGTWYTPQELHAFRVDTIETIHRIVAGTTVEDTHNDHNDDHDDHDDTAFCSRGCETRTPLGAAVRHRQRMESLWAVLHYQQQCVLKLRQRLPSSSSPRRKRRHGRVDGHDDDDDDCHRRRPGLMDVLDVEHVARLYAAKTQQSQHKAHFLALVDAQCVRRMNRMDNVAIQVNTVGGGCSHDRETASSSSSSLPTHMDDSSHLSGRSPSISNSHHPNFWEGLWDRLHHHHCNETNNNNSGSSSSHHHQCRQSS